MSGLLLQSMFAALKKKQKDMTEHEKCLTNGTYERARESGTEQNYNMIDGCCNNNPKKAACHRQQSFSAGSAAYQTGGAKAERTGTAATAAGEKPQKLKIRYNAEWWFL